MSKQTKEEWKSSLSLPPNIEVSSQGKVRQYVDGQTTQEIEGSIYNGYKCINAKGTTYPVHKLVAEAFVDNPEGLTIVRHINNDKLDNRAENLKWVKLSDNFNKPGGKGADSRDKIYCPELDQLYGTLRTAAYMTGLPQEFISESIREGYSACGLAFRKVTFDDPIVDSHPVYYVSVEDMRAMIQKSKSTSELTKQVKKFTHSK